MFRRNGGYASFMVHGTMASPRDPSFVKALGEHRFRSIEDASSERTSIGWVTPMDPTGETFAAEDLDFDAGIWLRIRIDRKRLPPAWLGIHRAKAERAAGRPLTLREKRELKVELEQRLLPRILPGVAFVDVIWQPASSRLLLFATSRSVKEICVKLFGETFEVTIEEAGPWQLAQESRLGREQKGYLQEVSAVQWPHANGSTDRAAPPVIEREAGE
ncbi:MAG: recombination-associated protein RdgC [Planctomycetota bacterium]|nr:recombination-associated protein RdgC [Planctomycetota bacterium]